MNPEKIIQLTRVNASGQEEVVDVAMRYCIAAEIGFSQLADKSIEVFNPETAEGEGGKLVVTAPPKATDDDYIKLSMAAITAAYEARSAELPVTAADILYHSTRKQTIDMMTAVMLLRIEWLSIPKDIKPEAESDGREKKRKNVKRPTTGTN